MQWSNTAYLCQSLKPQIMAFDCFNSVIFGKPPISIHDKGDMFGNWALTKGTNE